MTLPLDITLEILTSTSNHNAIDTLIPVLDGDHELISTRAAHALLKRSSTRGHVEVIRRFDRLSESVRDAVLATTDRLHAALKQSLAIGDIELRKNCLELVGQSDDFEHVPLLLQLLRGEQNDLGELTAQILTQLVSRLYEHCTYDTDHKAGGKTRSDTHRIREDVLSSLHQACGEFQRLSHPREVVEAVLALGTVEHRAVQRVLSRAVPACRDMAADLLLTSKHPGVMDLIMESMSSPDPESAVLDAVQRREDAEFVNHLLRSFPGRLSSDEVKNWRRIDSVRWLDIHTLSLDFVAPALQAPLVAFVAACGIPDETKLAVQEWLVRNGGTEGRIAAAELLAANDGVAARRVVVEGLDSEDEHLQAWATTRLRTHQVPEAFGLLVDRLDSPSEAVREAARKELQSFNVERMLATFDKLDLETCQRAGQLIRKIHPDYVMQFMREMSCPIRNRRIRAVQCAKALGLHAGVLPGIMALLGDTDSTLRRLGAETLGGLTLPDCLQALESLLNDPSQRVREAAMQSLAESRRKLAEQEAVAVSQ